MVQHQQPAIPPGFVPQGYPLWVAMVTMHGPDESSRVRFESANCVERVIAWVTRYTKGGDPQRFFDLKPVTTERVLLEDDFLFFGETPEEAEAQIEKFVAATNRAEEERIRDMH